MNSQLYSRKNIDAFIAPAGKGSPRDPLVGKDVCGYKIISKHAEGGMAAIYLATNSKGERAALKTLHPEHLDNPNINTRFNRECLAGPTINHQNIVRISGYDNYIWRTFLVMEFLEGKTLREMTGENMVTWPLIKELFPQACDAVHAAHQFGYIHRDISPENMFIRFSNPLTLKLLDFGTVCLVNSREWKKFAYNSWSANLTEVGEFFGKPHYAPPDILSEGVCKASYDVYSLGVILYELVTGKRPFESGNFDTLRSMHYNDLPRLPGEVGLSEAVPSAIDDIISRALAKKPENRFQSALEFKQAFLSL